jgi:hypothetical protein
MLAAAGEPHPKAVLQPGGADIEVARGKNQVIGYRQA